MKPQYRIERAAYRQTFGDYRSIPETARSSVRVFQVPETCGYSRTNWKKC